MIKTMFHEYMTVQELIDALEALTPEQKKLRVVYGCDSTNTGQGIQDVYEGLDYRIEPVIRLNMKGERWRDK